MPTREPLSSLVLYHLFKWLAVSPTFRFYCRGRLYGQHLVPLRGPLVVVSNHASDFDPPLLSCCVGRPVAYMAKEELFRIPILKQAIRLYGAYPVKRGRSDRAALQAALSYLDQGWATGVFLPGTRTPDGRIPEPKLGAALIAARAQAPMLPVSLWGTQTIRRRGWPAVTVRIGPPIPAPVSTERQELERVTRECVQVIHGLHDLGR